MLRPVVSESHQNYQNGPKNNQLTDSGRGGGSVLRREELLKGAHGYSVHIIVGMFFM
jgi:hypothetical protein